jgi:hypothetical protein
MCRHHVATGPGAQNLLAAGTDPQNPGLIWLGSQYPTVKSATNRTPAGGLQGRVFIVLIARALQDLAERFLNLQADLLQRLPLSLDRDAMRVVLF